MHLGQIARVLPNSLAEELGLQAGDTVKEVNGQRLRDIIDLSFAFADEEIDLRIAHEDGSEELLSFDKDEDEELGVEFASAVFDGIRACRNHCCFCFVDQMVPGMRKSLYIRDDDYRMSFLYGNFITMTNMGEKDFQRIAKYHLSPLFISVHATNPELRARLLETPRASALSAQLDRLQRAGVAYHAQVVLCPGLNDGAELDRTIRDMAARRPHVLSLAVVPVGLTRFRRHCRPLQCFDREGAGRVIRQVSAWQERERMRGRKAFVYLGDEFYFLAGHALPRAEEYDGFPQLDNGIGLARNFLEEWRSAKEKLDEPASYREAVCLDIISGTSIASMLQDMANALPVGNLRVRVLGVENEFFGKSVNVSGLLTGRDIITALRKAPGERAGVLLPDCALRSDDHRFLDGCTLEDLREAFPQTRIETVRTGADYFRALAQWPTYCGPGARATAYLWQSNAAYTK